MESIVVGKGIKKISLTKIYWMENVSLRNLTHDYITHKKFHSHTHTHTDINTDTVTLTLTNWEYYRHSQALGETWRLFITTFLSLTAINITHPHQYYQNILMALRSFQVPSMEESVKLRRDSAMDGLYNNIFVGFHWSSLALSILSFTGSSCSLSSVAVSAK